MQSANGESVHILISGKIGQFPVGIAFIIKLVKMLPGRIPHVVVGTLKISLDRLFSLFFARKKFSRVLCCSASSCE